MTLTSIAKKSSLVTICLPEGEFARPRDAETDELTAKRGMFLAECGGNGVLLDLVADRYLALDPMSTAIWKYLSDDYKVGPISTSIARDFALDYKSAEIEVVAQLRVWREWGLIVPADAPPPARLPADRPTGEPATGRVSSAELEAITCSLAHARILLIAKAWTHWSLKVAGLASTLVKLQRMASSPPRSAMFEDDVLRMLKTYRMLRLSWTDGRADCLVRSIQLARALRAIGVTTELCIGVDRFPFRAHAWLELSGRVVSETQPELQCFVVVARF